MRYTLIKDSYELTYVEAAREILGDDGRFTAVFVKSHTDPSKMEGSIQSHVGPFKEGTRDSLRLMFIFPKKIIVDAREIIERGTYGLPCNREQLFLENCGITGNFFSVDEFKGILRRFAPLEKQTTANGMLADITNTEMKRHRPDNQEILRRLVFTKWVNARLETQFINRIETIKQSVIRELSRQGHMSNTDINERLDEILDGLIDSTAVKAKRAIKETEGTRCTAIDSTAINAKRAIKETEETRCTAKARFERLVSRLECI